MKYKLPAIALVPPVLIALTIVERRKPAKRKASALSIQDLHSQESAREEPETSEPSQAHAKEGQMDQKT